MYLDEALVDTANTLALAPLTEPVTVSPTSNEPIGLLAKYSKYLSVSASTNVPLTLLTNNVLFDGE